MPSKAATRPARRRAPQRYTPDLADINAAADFLACHPRTIRRMIASGEIRGYRVGRVLRVDMNQLRDEVAVPVEPSSVAC